MLIRSGPVKSRRNLVNAVSEHWRPPVFTHDSTWAQRKRAALRRFFDLQAGSIWKDLKKELSAASGKVLDVGCGAQIYKSLLPDHVSYIGIDTLDAKARFGYEVPNTLYFSGETWPVEDQSIDLVLCTEVLEHIQVPRLFLSEANRCLKPGGGILLTVPFASRWHFIPHDYWRYTPSGLSYLLTEAGCMNIAVYARGNPVTVSCHKIMALLIPLLCPQSPNGFLAVGKRTLGLVTFPILFVLACIANLSLRSDWGDDCLGYTVRAEK